MKAQSELSLPTEAVFRSSPPAFNNIPDEILMEDQHETNSQPLAQVASQGERPTATARNSSTDTQRAPPNAQHTTTHAQALSSEDAEMEDDDSDPAEQIQDFDWDELLSRYHAAMAECEENQVALMQEWEDLNNFFQVWAQAGHIQETNRTYSRLKTRATHVQHSEENLEQKRLHYVSVVHAFESALRLLAGVSAG